MKDSLSDIKKKIIPILLKYNVTKAGIFGSYARGDAKKNSDIDVLVHTSKPMGFSFMNIQFELEKKLNKKIDLITYKSINQHMKDKILNEEVRIL